QRILAINVLDQLELQLAELIGRVVVIRDLSGFFQTRYVRMHTRMQHILSLLNPVVLSGSPIFVTRASRHRPSERWRRRDFPGDGALGRSHRGHLWDDGSLRRGACRHEQSQGYGKKGCAATLPPDMCGTAHFDYLHLGEDPSTDGHEGEAALRSPM